VIKIPYEVGGTASSPCATNHLLPRKNPQIFRQMQPVLNSTELTNISVPANIVCPTLLSSFPQTSCCRNGGIPPPALPTVRHCLSFVQRCIRHCLSFVQRCIRHCLSFVQRCIRHCLSFVQRCIRHCLSFVQRCIRHNILCGNWTHISVL